jgi:hypothetical protein
VPVENERRDGGGIHNRVSSEPWLADTGVVILRHSRVVGNVATIGPGGGIVNQQGATLVIRDRSRVTANESNRRAGGIFNRGSLTISHSRVNGNRTGFRGGGIYNAGPGRVRLLAGARVVGNSPDNYFGVPAC